MFAYVDSDEHDHLTALIFVFSLRALAGSITYGCPLIDASVTFVAVKLCLRAGLV